MLFRSLADVIPEWLNGLQSFPQDHTRATFTKKISKDDGLLDLTDDPVMNYKKIRAYDGWPGTYFFTKKHDKDIRVKVTDARLENGKLVITRVIPEGKNEITYDDFLRGSR